MFKKGDRINYGFYSNLEVLGEDVLHYILKDNSNNTKKIYKELVDKHGELVKKNKDGKI